MKSRFFDIVRNKDDKVYDYTERAFSNVFNPYTGIDYVAHIQNNINNFNAANASEIAKSISISSYRNTSGIKIINSLNSWNTVKNILDTEQGTLYAFDTETLGNIGRTNAKEPYLKYSGITEIGIARLQGNSSSQFSIAFGINEDQYRELLKTIEIAKTHGIDTLTGAQQSSLERASRYAGKKLEDVFELTKTKEFGNVYTVKNLAESAMLDLDGQVTSGARNLFNLGKMQSLDTEQGKSLFSRAMNFISETQNRSDAAILGFNLDYDMNVLKNTSEMLGIDFSINETKVADLYHASMIISDGRPLKNLRDVSKAFDRPLFTHHRPSSLEAILGAMGIPFDAHHAGSDSLGTLKLASSDLFKENKSFIDNLYDKIGSIQEQMNNASVYNISDDIVFRANRSLLYNKNDADFISRGNNVTDRFTTHGTNRGKSYRIGDIKEFKDGRVGVEYISAAEKDSNYRYVRSYDTIEDFESSLANDFTILEMNKDIDQATINRENLIVEADQARRKYDTFTDINSLQIYSDGTESGGFASWQEYYKWYDEFNEKVGISSSSITDDIVDRIGYGEYNKEIAEVIGTNRLSDIRNFENMYGRLADEREVFDAISGLISDNGKLEPSNRRNTLVANEVMQTLDNIISNNVVTVNDQNGLNVALNISRAVPENINMYSQASLSDVYAMDIWNDLTKEYTRISLDKPEEITSKLYNSLASSANRMEAVGSQKQALNSLLFSAVEDMQERGFFEDSYLDNLKSLVPNTNTAKPWVVASEIASQLETNFVSPLKQMGFSLQDYQNGLIPQEKIDTFLQQTDFSEYEKKLFVENLNNFVTNKTDRTMGQRVSLMKGSKLNVNGDIVSLNDFLRSNQSITENIVAAGDKVLTDISVGSQYDLLNNEELIKKKLVSQLNYTEDNANTVWRTIAARRSKGKGSYGIATYDNMFTAMDFPEEGATGESAYIIASQRKNQERIISVLENPNLTREEKLQVINGELSLKNGVIKIDAEGHAVAGGSAIGSYFEIKAVNRREFPGGELASISQGTKGYERIVSQSLNIWDKGGGLGNVDVTFSNSMDNINSAYRLIREKVHKDFLNEDYSSATRRYKNIINREMKDMPGFSGLQAVKGIDGGIHKVIVPNTADILQSSTIDLFPLKELVVRTAIETEDQDLARVLSMFTPNNQGDKTALEAMLDNLQKERRNNTSPDARSNEYFAKHLFLSSFDEEIAPYNVPATRTDGLKNTFIQKLYDYRYKFSEKTQETITNIYDNRDQYSQILKENQISRTKASTVNKLLYNEWSIFDATPRPTNLQQLTARRTNSIWSDASLYPEVFEDNNITIGSPISTKQKLDLQESMKQSDSWIVPQTGINLADFESQITGDVKIMSDLQIAKRYESLDKSLTKKISKYSNIDPDFDKDLYEYTYNLFKTEMNNVYESKILVRPSVANLEMFKTPDLQKFSNKNIANLSEMSKAKLREKLLKNNGRITNGFVLGAISENDSKNIIYDGPEGTIADIDSFIDEGIAYILPDQRSINDVKGMIGNEKGTLNLLLFNENDLKFANFIVRDEVGDIDVIQSQKLFNRYTDMVMNDVFGKDIMSVANFEIYKHASGGVIFGGYLNQISEMFSKAKKSPQEFINLMNEAGLDDLAFTYRQLKDKGGDIFKSSMQMNMATARSGGQMQAIENVLNIINERASSGDSFYKSMSREIARRQRNNITRMTLQKTSNNESMGTKFILDHRTEQSLLNLSIGKTTIDGVDYYGLQKGINAMDVDGQLKSYGEVLIDHMTRPARNSESYKSAIQSVEGIHLVLENFDNPEAVRLYPNVIELGYEELNIPKFGSEIEDLRNSVFKINGNPSAIIKEAAKARGISNPEDINVVKVNLTKNINDTITGGILLNADGKAVNSVLIPVLDIEPFEGRVFYSESEKSINKFFQRLGEYNAMKNSKVTRGNQLHNLQNAYDEMNLALANETIGKKGSYTYERLIRKPLANSGQVFAKSTDAPIVNAMMNPKWNSSDPQIRKQFREEVANLIEAGDPSTLADFYGNARYTVTKSGKRVYENVGRVSKEVFEDLGFDFEKAGEQLLEDFLQNGEIVNYKVNSAFDINPKEVFDALDIVLEKNLSVDFSGINRDVYNVSDIRGQIEGLLNRNFKENFDFKVQQDFDIRTATSKRDSLRQALKHYEEQGIKAPSVLLDNLKSTTSDLKEAREKIRTALISERKEISEKVYGSLSQQFDDISTNYLKTVGVYSLDTRYPVFYSGSSILERVMLDPSLKGRQAISAPFKSALQKLDHDGDTLFFSLMLASNDLNSKGGLLNLKDHKDFVEALDGYYNLANRVNNGVLADLVRNYQEIPDNITDIRRYMVELVNRFEPSLLEDANLKRNKDMNESVVDYVLNNYDEYKDIINKYDIEKGNHLTNIDALMTSIKGKVNKDNIGYISNINYKLRDVVYEMIMKNQEDMDKLKHVSNIKRDLFENASGLFWFTEQKGIDTKHDTKGLFISDTPNWRIGLNTLFTSHSDANRRAGLEDLYEATKYKLFQDDLVGTYEEQLVNKANTISRIMSADIGYDELKGYDSDNSAEQWFRSLLELSEMQEARDIYSRRVGGDNIKSIRHLKSVRDELRRSRATDLNNAADTLSNRLYQYSSGINYFDSIAIFSPNKPPQMLDTNSLYITNGDYAYGPLGYTLDEIKIGKDKTRVTFNAVDLKTLKSNHKGKGMTYGYGPKRVFEGTPKEINDQINNLFNSKNIVHRGEWKRDSALRTKTIDKLTEQNARAFVEQGSRRMHLFDDLVKGVPAHIAKKGDSAHLDAYNLAYKNYFEFVDKSELVDFKNKMEYIKSRGYVDKFGRPLVENNYDSILTEINNKIMSEGKARYSQSVFKDIDGNNVLVANNIFQEYIYNTVDRAAIGQNIDFGSSDFKQFESFMQGIGIDPVSLRNQAREMIDANAYDIDLVAQQLHKRFDSILEAAQPSKRYTPADTSSFNKKLGGVIDAYAEQNKKLFRNAESLIYGKVPDLNLLDKVFDWGKDPQVARVGFGQHIGTKISELSQANVAKIMAQSVDIDTMSAAKKYAIQQTQLHISRYEQGFQPNDVKVGSLGFDGFHGSEMLFQLNADLKKRGNRALSDPSPRSQKAMQQEAKKQAKNIFDDEMATKSIPDPSDIPTKGLGKLKGTVGKVLLAATALGMTANIISQKTQQSPLMPNKKPNGSVPNSSGEYSQEGQKMKAPSTKRTRNIYVDNSSGMQFKMSAKSIRQINQMDAADKIARESGSGSVDIHTYDDRTKISNNWLERKFAELM